MITLEAFFQSQAGAGLYAMIVVAFADFLLGTLAAIRDRTFTLEAVAAWLRKHLAGRVLPIGLLLLLGYFGNQAALLLLAVPAGAAYVLETIGSIAASWGPNRALQPVPED
jgi:hypothetical protein